MALSKQLKLTAFTTKTCEGQLLFEQQEDILVSAYIKVTKVEATKPTSQIFLEITGDKIVLFRSYFFEADLAETASNHIKQAYVYLKTLPEFSDAVDC
jgi:hypothetical protein